VHREKKEVKMTLNKLSAMHESTYQEDMKNKTYRGKGSCAMYEITYKGDVQYETFQEDGRCAKNVMTMALHHPRDYQNQTTSLALTMMGASQRHGEGEDQEDPLRHGGRGGHN
jgi:hypothetical protein